MSKIVIKNRLGLRTFGFAVPATSEVALNFAQKHLDGTYELYKLADTIKNEPEDKIYKVTVTGKSASGRKTTFSFYLRGDLNEKDVHATLRGRTFNGIKFDMTYIIDMRSVKLKG